MRYMLNRLVARFADTRYTLMAILVLFFMAMGSLIGSSEEIIPFVPIIVSLSLSLGWDIETGLAMSILAGCCGFATGIANPFTIGVAQTLAGLPMFSGIWLRILSFVLIYLLLMAYLRIHVRKMPLPEDTSRIATSEKDPQMNKALIAFGSLIGLGILIVLCSGFLPFLRDFTMFIVAVMFLVAGLVAVRLAGMRGKVLRKSFVSGMIAIAPVILMILMASSIRYIMTKGKILDTVIYYAVGFGANMSKAELILFIYLIVLVMNFFIPSGSAKAFLLILLIVPLAQMFGISAQLAIVAYAFGDGFSNNYYPTNAGLLISLGLAGTSYGKWFKFSTLFMILILLLTSGLLLFGLAVGYA